MDTTKISGFSSLLETGATKASTAQKIENSQNDFSSYVQTSWKTQQSSSFHVLPKHDKDSSDKEDTAGTAFDKYQYKDNTIASNDTNQQSVSDEVVSKTTEALSKYNDDVKSVLKDKLGVSDDEIEQAMTALGLQVQDLTNPQNLTALIAKLTGTNDNMSLLMSDSYQEIMKSITTLTSDLLKNLGIDMNQLQNICKLMTSGNSEATSGKTDVVSTESSNEAVSQNQNSQSQDSQNQKAITATDGNLMDNQTKQVDSLNVNIKSNDTHEDAKGTTANTQQTNTGNQNVVSAALQNTDTKSGENPLSDQSSLFQETAKTVETTGKKEETVGEETAGQEATDSKDKQTTGNLDKSSVNTGQTLFAENAKQDISSIQNNFTQVAQPQQSYIDVQNLIDQIAEYSKVISLDDSTTMQMQLNPENLGKIYIEVTHRAGAITATIAATNESVKDALQTQVANLKESLNQQGIKVDAVEVTIANHEFERNLEQNNNSNQQQLSGQQNDNSNQDDQSQQNQNYTRTLNVNYLSNGDDNSPEEELTVQMMKDNGNQMDITI